MDLWRLDRTDPFRSLIDPSPSHVLREEHLFVPRLEATQPVSGWILGTALDGNQSATQFSIFDVESVEGGPAAPIRLPYVLPLGIHDEFVPA